jgi:hypothetical protein
MARQTSARAGISATDLDLALPTPGAPPLADIIGAWVLTAADPAAVTAARILGAPDLHHLSAVVTSLPVLALFVVAPVINPIRSYYAGLATRQLDRITGIEGSATIVVTHHVKQPPTPSPSGRAGNSTASGTTIGGSGAWTAPRT